ncbi:MAG: MTH938/NDUFAF3 family protein [Elusimicrobiota bacterium]
MHIDSYGFGMVVIDGKKYSSDVLIIGERVISWWRKEGHLLQVRDLKEVWEYCPEVLIIGKGVPGAMELAGEVASECAKCNIELIALKTEEAVKSYNSIKDTKKTACGLHLTC